MLSKVMNRRYEQNDEILILYNTTHSKHEQDIVLKEKCEETYKHLNTSSHISYKKLVVNEMEGNIASKKQEHASADNTSLTKCLFCQTMFPYSLIELHAQTCVGNAANQTAENVEENLKRCQHCQSIFPDSLLEQHTQTCSRRKIHQCSECNKMFRIRSKLLIHQQSHSDERLHSCNICVKTFKFKSGLTRHMRQQHSGRDTTNIQTTLCEELQGLEYSSLHDDINDWEDSDQDENNVKEGKNFGQRHFEKQKRAVAREKVECGLLLNNVNQETSNDHGNIHEECKENNKQHSDAIMTNRPRQGQESSSYSQKGNDQDNFKEKVHSKSRIRNIREVSRKVTQNFEIKEKYSKLKNTEECEENDRELNIEGSLEPNEVFDECCPDVTPPFNMQSYRDSKVYKCQECPKIFAKPSRLAIHSRTHSDERLFFCEICQQTFKYKGSLNRHVKEQHYGQRRKSLGIGIDERPKKEPKNCSAVEKVEFRNDMYIMNVDESKDGVFKHWKERHFSQGGMKMNKRDELENTTFLEKSNFENDGECLVSLKNNLDKTDGEGGSLSKIVDERTHSLEKNEFENDDQNLMKKYEELKNKETCGKSFDKGQNVNFGRVKKTVALLDESSFEKDYVENNVKVQKHVQHEHNMIFDGKQDEESIGFKSVYNTDEEHARYGNVSMVFDRGQEGEQSLSSQDESIFENIDNSTESHTIDTETCKYGESDLELQETLEQTESGRNERNFDADNFEFGVGADHSDEGENIFEVISRPSEGLNECFTSSLVNTQKENKLHKCNVCQKFIKRSAWWNHMLTHNDNMSFTCEFCWKYFKYKGSLFRHIKEQHYGLRRGSKMALDKSLDNNISCSTQETNDLEKEIKSFEPISNGIITSRSMICDKMSRNDNRRAECSYQKGNNYRAILKEGENGDSNVKTRSLDASMIFDKRPGNNDSYFSPKKVNFGLTMQVKTKQLDAKHCDLDNAYRNDVITLTEENVCVQENDNEDESSLQEVQKEERTLAIKQYQFDECHNNFDEFQLTCKICGKCFRHKGSRTRHVKEQHYGLGRKSLKMVPDENQEVGCLPSCDEESSSFVSVNEVEHEVSYSRDTNVSPSVKSFREETFDFEIKESYENQHSDKDNFMKESSFENLVDEDDQEDHFYDEQNASVMKKGFEKENDDLNKNSPSFKHDLLETNQEEERKSASKQDSFNAHGDKLTCDFCGKCYKHQPSLCRHVKEQHYGLKRKNSKMLSSQKQNNGNSEAILNDRNINQSVNFIKSEETIDVREETFEENQSDFEMKKSDENKHSEQDNFTEESCFKKVLGEVDQQDDFVDEETNDSSTVKECFEQENKDFNTSCRSFEDDLQETDQEEQTLANKQDSFNAHSDKLTCDFCGKCYKHQPSLCRHVKEQHYGVKRKNSKMLSSQRQNNGNSEAILNDRNANRSVNFIKSEESIDVREETFEVKQSDFEMKKSDENKHSEQDNFTEESCFKKVLDETDEQDNFVDEETNDTSTVKECSEQENKDFNTSCRSFEDDLQETDQEEQTLASKQDSFNAHSDKLTCDFCGKCYKHQPSLCRHVKEQHYGLKRKYSRMLSSQRQNNGNSEAILNDRNVNQSVNFIKIEESIDVREETFEVKQRDFEMKKSDGNKHSEQDNFTEESCSENVLDEVDQQNNFVDQETNDTTMVKKGFEQGNNYLNTNGRSFEDDMQETDQEEQTLASKQHSFSAHSDKLTCDFCGKCYKHQPSLCRHVKEQHYGLKKKSSGMLSSKRQNNVNSCSLQKHGHLADRFNNPEAILNNRNVNQSVNFTTSHGNIDVREETFEVKQNDFEMKESDENIHSEQDNVIKETSFKNILGEVDEEERTSGSQQENFDDEQTYDATMARQDFEQENDNLNKNGHSFEHDLQETDQEEQKLASTQNIFNAHDNKFEKSRRLEITCDFCGKYFKHQPSLCRHVKEQHYGMKRKSSRMLSSQRENNVNSYSSQKHGYLANNPEEILNDKKDTNLKEKSCEPKLIFDDERQVSENGCLSHGKDNLQNRLGETVKGVDGVYEDENFEQNNFEINETSKHEQNYIVPKKEYDFEQRFQEIDLEKRVLETNHDHVDICDSVEVNISKGNKLFREKADMFKCQECPKIFQSRTALRKHKRVHSDDMSFACEFCQQTFKYKGSLNRHVKEQHYGLGRKSFRKMSDERIAGDNECPTVGKVNPGSMVKDVFYEDTNFTEENCKRFNFEERRMDNKHDGSDVATMSKEGNFPLQQSKFYKKINVDTKQKNFVHDCHEKAKNKIEQEQSSCEMKNSSLKVKKIHRCVQCPRTFWNSSELREHSYKHTDVKSFACKLCGKAFKFRSGLVRHNRKEHKGSGLTDNVSKNNLGHGFGEETLQHSTFWNDLGNKDPSEFREGYGRIKPTKRKFSGRENDFKTGIEERSRIEKFCLNSESEDNSDFNEDIGASGRREFGGGDECFKTIVNENSVNEEISTQSLRQNLPIKKKPSIYKCNKCDATFNDLCDFLAHQRIHK